MGKPNSSWGSRLRWTTMKMTLMMIICRILMHCSWQLSNIDPSQHLSESLVMVHEGHTIRSLGAKTSFHAACKVPIVNFDTIF
ncbi:hypothetical protein DFH29DRAFT_964183, partial [Suillus ampliporus]